MAGTDWDELPGHGLHRELEVYVDAGMTPMEAIQSATIVPARAMRLDKELGTIEAGKRADIIVIDGIRFARSGTYARFVRSSLPGACTMRTPSGVRWASFRSVPWEQLGEGCDDVHQWASRASSQSIVVRRVSSSAMSVYWGGQALCCTAR